MKVSGVYEILNTVNGKRYIGSAKNINGRWALHRKQLSSGKHHSKALQRAWNKYGEAAFEFSVMLICAPIRDHLLTYEGLYFKRYNPEYNICKIPGSPLGFRHSVATRAKMSFAKRGTKTGPPSLAHREAISKANTGRVFTPEHKEKLAAAKRGKKQPAEHTAKIAESNRGKHRSEETKQRISEALRGNSNFEGHTHTPETRLKMSMWQIGRIMSANACANMSLSHVGVPWSPARRAAFNLKKEQQPC